MVHGRNPPEPVAQGSLASTPFAHVLLHLLREAKSGTLAVWPDEASQGTGQDRILFQDGVAVAGRLLEPATALDRGLLPLFRRERAPYAFYEQDLVGDRPEVLKGSVSTPALIAASLRGPVREDVVDAVLSRLGDAPLRYRSRYHLDELALLPAERAFVDLVRAAPATVDELVRQSGDERRARRLLYLLAITRSLEVDPSSSTGRAASAATSSQPGSSGAAPAGSSHAASSGSSGAASAGSSRAASAGSSRAASASASHAASAGASADDAEDAGIELPTPPPPPPAQTSEAARASSGPSAPEGGGPSPAPSQPRSSPPPAGRRKPKSERAPAGPERPPDPPANLSPEHAAQWREVSERVVAIDTQTYFEMLDVDKDASHKTVEAAYVAQVKKWHPDRLPAELAPLAPFVQQIFHHITEAKDTLTDDEKRGPYLKSVQQGGGTPEADRKVSTIVGAAMEFQKVEVLAKRKQWDEALEVLELVLEASPEEADFHAMHGWLLFQKHGATDDLTPTILRSLDHALELNPKNERAHFARGQVTKQLGRSADALRHFEKVVELNPRHIEAAREIRLASMRQRKAQGARSTASASREAPGLLSKLFGAKKK